MKSSHVVTTLSLCLAAFAAGCSSTTTMPTDTSASQTDATVSAKSAAETPKTATVTSVDAATAPSPDGTTAATPAAKVVPHTISPEAAAVVERLTQTLSSDTLPHELADTTGFPEALLSLEAGAPAPKTETIDLSSQPPPEGLTADGSSTQLVVRDWTGLVLVPISTSLSTAYTSEVRLLKVEAHPLNDGRVRIWTRIHNRGNRTLPGQVACAFRMRGMPTPTSPYFYELQVPAHGFRDVFFISPDGELTAYTVLVRSEDMRSRRN